MHLNELLTRVDAVKPNTFTTAQKINWLNEVEGLVQTEILLLDPLEFIIYPTQPEQGYDPELLAHFPYDKIYWAYLCAMVDFCNGEYNRYNNTISLFNAWFGEFSKWYSDRYRPADGRMIVRGYYLTAYALAVAHGFVGTEEEWIASLKGEKGDRGPSPYIGEDDHHWYVWDEETEDYVDTGVDAAGYLMSQDDADARYLRIDTPGTTIQANDDLDDYTTPGVYRSTGTPITSTLLHCPIGTGTIQLIVNVASPANTFTQLLIGGFGAVYMRNIGLDGVPSQTTDWARLDNTGLATEQYVDDALEDYTKTSDLADVATSGDYDDLENKPTIPTVNNATLTIKQGGVVKGTFSANASSDAEIDLDGGGGGVGNGAYYTTATLSPYPVAIMMRTFPYGAPSGAGDIVLSSAGDIGVVTAFDPPRCTVTRLVEGAYTKDEIDTMLDGKQATIIDLATIREGATAGATAVQPEELADVATSGSYNDLEDKPTIPTAVTEETVSGWGFTKNTGTYSKPSGGIPESDLSSAVQTSLGLADSALQSVPNTYRTAAEQDLIDADKQTKVSASGILKGDGDGGVSAAVAGTDYQAPLETVETSSIGIDNAPTSGSNNLVKSGGVYSAIDAKEAKGKITISGVEKTAETHTVTIVTNGVTTTMTLVGVS